MKKWISLITVLFIVLGVNFSGVLAQSYSFKVPKAAVAYYILEDGTAAIEYTYQFVNNSGAPDIEFVDVGMPANSKFNYNNMSAEIDGHEISHIQKSEYVSNAVEFGLGDYSIPANGSGTFHAMIWGVENVIFVGTAEEAEAYAGSQFQPNYFESGTVSGSTDMTITLILPAGMTEEEPRYYTPQGWPGEDAPLARRDDQGRITYTWQDSSASMTSRYVFGASFPARYVPEDKILEEPVNTSSSGSGFVNTIGNFFENSACCGVGFFFMAFFGWSIYQSTVGAKKRKMKYLPPKISIEGHGIKRGLTAVEAAILLEEPMDKVLTMVLFSVVKKGAATVITKDPLKLEFSEPIPEGMRAYEVDFLRAFKEEKPAIRRKELQTLMVKLVKSVTKKIKGFSYKETVEYYKNITEKAWKHVEAAETPEVSMQNLDEAMEWTMLDKEYEDRSKRVFTGPVYVPMWWGRYDPSFGSASAGGGAGKGFSSGKSSGGQSVSLPHLPGSDFAASVVTGIQGFSAGVIGDLTKFTGGITDSTNPIPKSTYSGRSSGGSGCACACACACASCACACAGGGR